MALPKLNETSSYSMVIPSTGQEVLYRPYLVKEEKVLLMAFESNDEKQAMRAMVDTIVACVKEDINPKRLATFDVEYMFTQIRSKSVGETAKIGIKCSECETSNEVSVNLAEIEVTKGAESAEIELTPTISVEMRYPSFSEMAETVKTDMSESQFAYDTVTKCIGAIITEDERFSADDVSNKEMMEFVEGLTSAQFVKVAQWLQDMPKMKKETEFTCKACGHENSHTLEGMQSFF